MEAREIPILFLQVAISMSMTDSCEQNGDQTVNTTRSQNTKDSEFQERANQKGRVSHLSGSKDHNMYELLLGCHYQKLENDNHYQISVTNNGTTGRPDMNPSVSNISAIKMSLLSPGSVSLTIAFIASRDYYKSLDDNLSMLCHILQSESNFIG